MYTPAKPPTKAAATTCHHVAGRTAEAQEDLKYHAASPRPRHSLAPPVAACAYSYAPRNAPTLAIVTGNTPQRIARFPTFPLFRYSTNSHPDRGLHT